MCSPDPSFSSFHRLGRQKVLIWTYLQLAVSGTCTAFTPNFSAYCICRFLSGMATSPINSNSVTLSERKLGGLSSWELLNHSSVDKGT